MSDDFKIWLPFPPSVNHLFAHGVVKGRVRRFPTSKYKAWQTEAVIRLRAQWKTKPAYEMPVVVKLELTPPDTRGRDADNFCKPVLDALVTARILTDDSNRYVKAVIPYWLNPAPQKGVVVIIRPAVNLGRGALTPAEMRLLAAVQHGGLKAMPANHKPSLELRNLLEKGYVEPIPGLLDGVPQGYRLIA